MNYALDAEKWAGVTRFGVTRECLPMPAGGDLL